MENKFPQIIFFWYNRFQNITENLKFSGIFNSVYHFNRIQFAKMVKDWSDYLDLKNPRLKNMSKLKTHPVLLLIFSNNARWVKCSLFRRIELLMIFKMFHYSNAAYFEHLILFWKLQRLNLHITPNIFTHHFSENP